jgi:hypothetical protein
LVAICASVRESQRPLLFALAVLIHIGLFQLLVSRRYVLPTTPEQGAALVFLRDAEKSGTAPRPIAPHAPIRLPETSIPEITAPRLIVPNEREGAPSPPTIDWQREAQETAQKHALQAEAQRDRTGDDKPAKRKPEFGWDPSRAHRVQPLQEGGLLVRINDRCAIVITVLAMPVCQIGKKPARGDLFEHMGDAPTPGDWKDE